METIPVIIVTESRPSMDKEDTVHISIVEDQSPNNNMDNDLHDSTRSSFISTNSSGTSGTSEADDFNYRDSVISTSSMDSVDRSSLYSGDVITGGLGRVGSTRSMPPERIQGVDSDPEEIHGLLSRDIVKERLSRKTGIRRHHTVTPNSSPKVRDRRNRSNSSTEEPLENLLENVPKEFFTLTFELRVYSQTRQIVAARNLSLREAIRPILAETQIDLRTVDVFIESSSTPTPFELPTFPLSGRHLYVRAKSGKNSRANSPSFSRRSMEDPDFIEDPGTVPMRKDMKKFFGVESNELHQAATPRQSVHQPQKKDLTKHLGLNDGKGTIGKNRRKSVPVIPQVQVKEKVDPKLLALKEKLDDFMISGLPDFPALLTFSSNKRENDDEAFQIEESWRSYANPDDLLDLTKKEMDQQEAIWEIVKTEVGYIKNIRIIVDFYLCTLINLQASLMLNEVETEKIFSNISAIETLHTRFWKDRLSKVISNARQEKRILSAIDLAVAFEGFPDLFAPYIKFCTDEADCLVYLREREKENEMLKHFIDWAQRHPESKRLKLRDLLVYPMQRITKYPLLLHAVEKKTVDKEVKAVVTSRISEVKEFVLRVNHELRQEEERQKMELTISRLDAYEAVSVPSGCDELAKLVEENSYLDLMCSMPDAPPQHARWLLMQGSLKLRDGDSSRVDAYGFLFTDMLVIARQRKSEQFRVIKPPMRVDRLRVQELKDFTGFALVHLDDYDCAAYGCVLSTPKTATWLQKIQAAKDLYSSICDFKIEYPSGEELDDGSGEPPTSPEAMIMRSTAFPFMDSSPNSSPLNSPKLPMKHLLSVDIKRARSSSSLSSMPGGGVSPVPEEEGEEGVDGGRRDSDEDDILTSPTDGDSNYFDTSSEDTVSVSSYNLSSSSLHGRASLPQTIIISSPTSSGPDEVLSPKTPTRRPGILMPIPPSANNLKSPSSPAADIISFDESDDEEAPPQENSVYTFDSGSSPKRKTSQQVNQILQVKNTKKRSTSATGHKHQSEHDKSKEGTGDQHKCKSKKKFSQITNNITKKFSK
ncbi:pleckstrin homology domain-containing family G member 5-like isoform X1 [Asterias amurensis]|uniref:pleckstrin homology domain-containing family G member 5-like isoform X1 n=2 Tax=Asterias amurensis TaxID=7602 RepID=UPI003AB78B5B